jgi:hypothetical protein
MAPEPAPDTIGGPRHQHTATHELGLGPMRPSCRLLCVSADGQNVLDQEEPSHQAVPDLPVCYMLPIMSYGQPGPPGPSSVRSLVPRPPVHASNCPVSGLFDVYFFLSRVRTCSQPADPAISAATCPALSLFHVEAPALALWRDKQTSSRIMRLFGEIRSLATGYAG